MPHKTPCPNFFPRPFYDKIPHMLKIKLSPLGKKNSHTYRIVVMEDKSKITGKNLAVLGQYNPLSNEIKLDKTEVDAWTAKGAQLTDRVKKLYNLVK